MMEWFIINRQTSRYGGFFFTIGVPTTILAIAKIDGGGVLSFNERLTAAYPRAYYAYLHGLNFRAISIHLLPALTRCAAGATYANFCGRSTETYAAQHTLRCAALGVSNRQARRSHGQQG